MCNMSQKQSNEKKTENFQFDRQTYWMYRNNQTANIEKKKKPRKLL